MFLWQLHTYSPYPEYKTPPHPSQYYAKIDEAFMGAFIIRIRIEYM